MIPIEEFSSIIYREAESGFKVFGLMDNGNRFHFGLIFSIGERSLIRRHLKLFKITDYKDTQIGNYWCFKGLVDIGIVIY